MNVANIITLQITHYIIRTIKSAVVNDYLKGTEFLKSNKAAHVFQHISWAVQYLICSVPNVKSRPSEPLFCQKCFR
jgi:hypothetical protein